MLDWVLSILHLRSRMKLLLLTFFHLGCSLSDNTNVHFSYIKHKDKFSTAHGVPEKFHTEFIYTVRPQDSALNLVDRHYDIFLHDFILSETNKSVVKTFSIRKKGKQKFRKYRVKHSTCNGTSNRAHYFKLTMVMEKMFEGCNNNSTLFGVFLISVNFEQLLEFDGYFKICRKEPGVQSVDFCHCTAVCETLKGQFMLWVVIITFGSFYVVLMLYSKLMMT